MIQVLKFHAFCVCAFTLQESKSHYRTIAKTRTYMKDGQVVTSTTTKVIATGEENKVREDHLHRLVLSTHTHTLSLSLSLSPILFPSLRLLPLRKFVHRFVFFLSFLFLSFCPFSCFVCSKDNLNLFLDI